MGRGLEHATEYRQLVALLKRARLDAGMTQVQLADALRRPQSYVSKIERAERLIDPVELRQICRALGTDLGGVIDQWEKALG